MSQEIQEAQNPCYLTTPREDENYVISENQDGIKIMTVKSGVTGLKYFHADVTPVRSHNGDETLVFVHLRNGQQLSLNSTCGDFDLIDSGGAGFNVGAGDMVKIYMVDRLTNDINSTRSYFNKSGLWEATRPLDGPVTP